MAERPINVFGMPDCLLPNGDICETCCYPDKHEVRSSYGVIQVKQANSPCPMLNSVNSKGRGCPMHNTNQQSHPCTTFHCSRSREPLRIIATTLAIGDITTQEAIIAASLITGNDYTKHHLKIELCDLAIQIASDLSPKPLPLIELEFESP